MKRFLCGFLAVITIALCTAFLIGCNTSDENVPVYEGMSVTPSKTSTTPTMLQYKPLSIALLNSTSYDSGRHNYGGWIEGDYKEGSCMDKNDPFPENGDDETIEEEIDDTLDIIDSDKTIYYAEQNQDVYFNIYINNPNNYEILSFTLNGKKYSSYMFEDGSDMEHIIIKYNVGDAHGIVDYTIDAIKYVDGSEIKDVLIGGERTVRVGISVDNQVAVDVDKTTVGINEVSFDFAISDADGLVKFSNGYFKAVVYDGKTLIRTIDLNLDDTQLKIDDLKAGTVYQIAIVAFYDNFKEDGPAPHVLYEEGVRTLSPVEFEDVSVGYHSISYGFSWMDGFDSENIISLKLYKDDEFVKDIDFYATGIEDLLSNTSYSLVLEYQNAERTENASIFFGTKEKETPSLIFIGAEAITYDEKEFNIEFNYTITDNDQTIKNIKIEISDGTNVISLDDITLRKFTNLKSSTSYTIIITYTYNKGDGQGDITVVYESKSVQTQEYRPTIESTKAWIEDQQLYFELLIYDPDNLFAEATIELYNPDLYIREGELENLPDKYIRYICAAPLIDSYPNDTWDGIILVYCNRDGNLCSEYENSIKVTIDSDFNVVVS